MIMLPPDIWGNVVALGVSLPERFPGRYNIIESGVTFGENVTLGNFCTIKQGCRIGAGTVIGDYVRLGEDSWIGAGCRIADGVHTTGPCRIGDNVNIRTGAIISKRTILEDLVFVGPAVVTNHTKHVRHGRPGADVEKLVTYVGAGSVIGSQTAIVAGIHIAPLSIIGAASLGTKDIEDGHAVYMGAPWKRVADLPDEYDMELPCTAGFMYVADRQRLSE